MAVLEPCVFPPELPPPDPDLPDVVGRRPELPEPDAGRGRLPVDGGRRFSVCAEEDPAERLRSCCASSAFARRFAMNPVLALAGRWGSASAPS